MLQRRTEVTAQDRKGFQQWLEAQWSRYNATRGMRGDQDSVGQHVRVIDRSVAIGNNLRESVPRALAALAVPEKVGDPLSFLRSWVGPSFENVARSALALLQSERDSVERFAVFGLWCENDGCLRFIRPVAVRRAGRPSGNVGTSEVCWRCGLPTVMWGDHVYYWVRCAPDLSGRAHPMRPQEVYAWVNAKRPRRNREARLIAQ